MQYIAGMGSACSWRRAVAGTTYWSKKLAFPKTMRNYPFKRDYEWEIILFEFLYSIQ
ncbi:conserved domain protein [Prevotella denticola CRIS 18C-A]|uniref:Conserved domain protein n=1 Tax=Prevotella denticola CRIS 18C-A TaxID=944557 RepID=F0H747_9BACT|nr:conserved domain protein [Prevotella denticola CRIS 18C-A]